MSNVSEKKKIVIIENNLAVGGVQRLVLDQLTTLNREKFDITLVTLTQPNRETFYDVVPKYVPVVKLHFKDITDIRSWFSLYRVLKSEKPDVVKSTTYFSNTIVRILKPLLGCKVIVAEHNTKDAKSPFQKFVNRILSRLSYTTIVDSKMVATYLSESEHIPKSRYTIIYNGVDMDKVRASEVMFTHQRDVMRAEHGIKPHEKLFLNIGRLVTQKNHLRMIDSFAELCQKRDDVKLMIIGDGPNLESIYKKMQQYQIEDKVILPGLRKDIHRFYFMSDVTLLSSDHEGFCIAAMEGLAFGAPLVSTKVAGVSEYLKDDVNGYFADMDPHDLAEKMDIILNLSSEDFTAMQRESRCTAELYSVKKYGEAFNTLLLECLK